MAVWYDHQRMLENMITAQGRRNRMSELWFHLLPMWDCWPSYSCVQMIGPKIAVRICVWEGHGGWVWPGGEDDYIDPLDDKLATLRMANERRKQIIVNLAMEKEKATASEVSLSGKQWEKISGPPRPDNKNPRATRRHRRIGLDGNYQWLIFN